jgi:glycine cleavage system aminomethyltransferase T
MKGVPWLDMFMAGLVLGASIGGLCSALGGSPIAAMLFGANLGWACKFDTDFIGKEALLKQKETDVTQKLIGFELTEKGVPRPDYSVTTETGQPIGTVVTGLYAPTVAKYCGHAFVSPAFATVGTPLKIIIRDKPKAAIVVKRPFYIPTYRR